MAAPNEEQEHPLLLLPRALPTLSIPETETALDSHSPTTTAPSSSSSSPSVSPVQAHALYPPERLEKVRGRHTQGVNGGGGGVWGGGGDIAGQPGKGGGERPEASIIHPPTHPPTYLFP